MAAKKRTPDHGDGNKYMGDDTAKAQDGNEYAEERKSFDELATGGRVMKKGEHEKKHRARGGKVDDDGEGSGKPEFFAGEKSPTAKAAEGDKEAKTGGRIRRKARKSGGRVEGKAAHARLDRAKHHPGMKRRAMGGGVGADMKPLTEAHMLKAPKGDKRTAQDDPTTDD